MNYTKALFLPTCALLTCFFPYATCAEEKETIIEGVVIDWEIAEAFDSEMNPLPIEKRKTLVAFDGDTAYILDYHKAMPAIPKGCKLKIAVAQDQTPTHSFDFSLSDGVDYRKQLKGKLLEVSNCPSLLENTEITIKDEKGNVIKKIKK